LWFLGACGFGSFLCHWGIHVSGFSNKNHAHVQPRRMQHEWRTPQISTNSVERLGKTWHPEMAQLILPLALTPFFPQVPDLGTETSEPRMARILFEFQRMIGVRPFGCSMVFSLSQWK